MKPFTSSVTYSASAAEVRAALIDPAFLDVLAETVSRRFNGEVRSREVTNDGEAVLARMTVFLPADQLGPARTFLKNGVEATIVQRWEPEAAGVHEGSYELTTNPDKATVRADFTLTDADGGSQRTYDGQVTVKVPLVGGMVEGQAVDRIDSLMGLERRAVEEYLASR